MNIKLLKQILTFAPLLAAIVLFFLLSNANSKKSELSLENKELSNDNYKKDIEIETKNDFITKLQKTKTQIEVTFKEEKGKYHKEYTSNLKKKDNLIARLKNKPPQYIIVKDTATDINTLSDCFKKPNLTLDYTLKYKGEFLGIYFDYTVKQKIVTKDNIIYESYPVEKIKYVKTNFFQISYSYGLSTDHKIHDFSVAYITKFGVGFKLGAELFDGIFMPKAGVIIQIPKK